MIEPLMLNNIGSGLIWSGAFVLGVVFGRWYFRRKELKTVGVEEYVKGWSKGFDDGEVYGKRKREQW